MSEVIAIQQVDDPQDVIHRAIQSLANGQLIILPTETRYVLAANALKNDASARLKKWTQELALGRTLLATTCQIAALDYVPGMNALAQRLMRRCWPGPVGFEIQNEVELIGLCDALPVAARDLVCQDGLVGLRVPAHDVIKEILRLLPGPLLLTGEFRGSFENEGSSVPWAGLPDEAAVLTINDGRTRYNNASSLVRVHGASWKMIHEGVITERTIKHLASHYVLFVCTGNTCRSPMAEALFRRLLASKLGCLDDELASRGFLVASAGLGAVGGDRPSPQAVEVMNRKGIDLTNHESQPFSDRLVMQADQIFTMTRSHRDAILDRFPDAANRVQMVAANGRDISDPYGSHVDVYQKCAEELEQHLQVIVDRMTNTP